MKRLISILLLTFVCSVLKTYAQTNVSVDTSVPVSTQISNVRYEFIQSTQNNLHAFLLDKFTGQVWRYKIVKKEFEELKREKPDIVIPDKVNYQMYISADNNSMCFLLNVHTGQMWRYIYKDGERIFRKMDMPWDSIK